ncbi:MAG TPA: PAS domain S-box protein, partial [Acidimicrobiia bacterium]|nr:PAS domain S-box protein [Acidimicrobiia bacterium]
METTGEGTARAVGAEGRRPRRLWPLRAYVVGLVVVFGAAVGIGTVYMRAAAVGDARRDALQDARFGAVLAAREIRDAVDLARATVSNVAANPSIAGAFTAPAGCTLTFGGAGPFTSGHLDIVASDGSVACSSRPSRDGPGYADTDWSAAAGRGLTVAGPVDDPATGKQVVVVVAPIGDKGVLAAFLDLDSLGPGLAKDLGGPRGLEFLVTSLDGRTALARSLLPTRWAGADLGESPFARARDAEDRPDVAGVPRLYGEATVAGLGWKVHAGADRADALAAAHRLVARELGISLVGLLVFLLAVWVVHRRIARPVQRLSTAVSAAASDSESTVPAVSGPAEIVALADDFARLVAAARRELEVVSRLAAVVETTSDAVILSDLDGSVTGWNAGAVEAYGYTAEEAVGSNVLMLVPPEHVDEVAARRERLLRGEVVRHFETQGLRKDGTLIDVSVAASPVRDANGMLVGTAAIIRDITDAKQAEADHLALEERLHQSQRLESLGQLAGGIAHDFNNLLGIILNYATFAVEQLSDNDAVRADIEEIRAAAERAARLTRRLLIVGRRETAQPEALDLDVVVPDMQSLLQRSIGEHVEVVVRAVGDLPPILADRGRVEQVLLNLAVNARDAMPGGGTLTLATRPAVLDAEVRRRHPDLGPGPYVELSVTDTGTGMTPEVLAHLFEPFFTTKPPGEGTGLGLATVYAVVTEAGGAVSVESEPGAGTTFRAFFPAA